MEAATAMITVSVVRVMWLVDFDAALDSSAVEVLEADEPSTNDVWVTVWGVELVGVSLVSAAEVVGSAGALVGDELLELDELLDEVVELLDEVVEVVESVAVLLVSVPVLVLVSVPC